MNDTSPVIIVGAGIAGLACANYLQGFGIPCTLLEADDRPGGRARTDHLDGFRLDRGFQIFLTAYPEAKRLLDYEALGLKSFRQGATIRLRGKFTTLPNPLREPLSAPQALLSPVGSMADKFKVVQLTGQLSSLDDEEIFRGPATSTLTYLSGFGWSEKMIRNFFQPFLGGIFLEKELITSSHFFRFVFQKFYQGDAALPAEGIEALPRQLAARLPAGAVRTGVRVQEVRGRTVRLENGDTLTGRAVVLATDASAAARLLGDPLETVFNQTTCLYFAADASPLTSPMLVINAEPGGLVNHLAVVSDVAPGYAPPGKSLVSVNLVGTAGPLGPDRLAAVRDELASWFGEAVHGWRHLRTYAIPEALPRFTAGQPGEQSLKLAEGLYRCGDYAAYPSYNASMLTGRHVAEQIAGR